MIDGISIWTRQNGLAIYLLGCSELEFIQQFKMDQPDAITYIAIYYGLKFEIFPSGLIRIRGSLHKFFNEGLSNDDDFTYGKLCATLYHLRDNFGIDINAAEIHHLEYGFNLKTAYDVNDFLSHLISCNGKPFNYYDMGNYMYIEMKHAELKFYNKNPILNNILRIELKAKKMSACKAGPLILSDLLKPQVWEICANQLFDRFNQVIMTDQVNVEQLTPPEKRIFELGNNPRSWDRKNATPQERYRLKPKFNDIILAHGQFQHKPNTLKQMKQKYADLLYAKSL